MEPQDAIDVARDAVVITMLISSPVLIAGMVVGLAIGLLQALTQIQDQTVAFVPKVVAMVLTMTLALPWLVIKMLEYVENLFINIPNML